MNRQYAIIRFAALSLLLLGFHGNLLWSRQFPVLRFDRITVNEGLSENAVTLVFQDSRGFIWIGTHDGLNKFDGYRVTVYKHDPDEPGSLSDNAISALCEDDQGMLWVGTIGGGVNRFNPFDETSTAFKYNSADPYSLSENVIHQIFKDGKNRIWISNGRGIDRLEPVSGRFVRYRDTFVGLLFEDSSGTVWLMDSQRTLFFYDETADRFAESPSPFDETAGNEFYNLRFVWNSDLLLLCRKQEILSFTLNHKRMVPTGVKWSFPPDVHPNTIIWAVKSDSGKIWLATTGQGLIEIDEKIGTLRKYKHNDGDPSSLSRDFIYHLYKDRSGIIWISTEGGGVSLIKENKMKFPLFRRTPEMKEGISGNYITSIFKEENGDLWIGTGGTGLNRINKETGRTAVYRHDPEQSETSLSNDYITAIARCADPGFLWIGTREGLNKLEVESGSFTQYKSDPAIPGGLAHNEIHNAVLDSRENLWVIAYLTLHRLSPEHSGFIRYPHDPEDPETVSLDPGYPIFEDKKGILWIGSWRSGLNRFDENEGFFRHYIHNAEDSASLSHNRVWAIHEDRRGRMWVGTWGGGLNLFDKKSGRFIRYNERHGLANNVIYGILEDESGRLWISTNKGLSCFNPETEIFRNYDVDDGLQGNEFNSRAFFRDGTGTMYFGGINGYNAFHPESIRDNPNIPPVEITSVRINSQKKTWDRPFVNIGTVNLDWEENSISFEFSALDFTCPKKNRYRYRLERFDSDWNEVGADRRFADYRNLPPGPYTFRILASNNDGIWNEAGASFAFRIRPPFWKTWYFRLGLLILFSFISYFTISFVKDHLRFSRFWKTRNTIGDYRIIETIGSGGMGVIYKGTGMKNGPGTVAIKVLREELSKDENLRRRFINEGSIIDGIDHPNIVRIHERIDRGNELYLVMEYLEGITLKQKMELKGILPPDETSHILSQLTEAVSALHSRGIIHRDLKPENIMLIRSENADHFVKLLDFGVARTFDLTRLTRSGFLVGTVGYMPPEQVSHGEYGTPGDIYALGILLYEMVTGQKPFSGDTSLEIMKQVAAADPVAPVILNPDISEDLNDLILKMIDKDPHARPSAHELKRMIPTVF